MKERGSIVIIGNPASRRVELFQTALSRLNLLPARVVPYTDLIRSTVELPFVVHSDSIVRIESPGKDFEVECALLAEGEKAAEQDGHAFIPKAKLQQLSFDRGRILAPRQWYLGYLAVLKRIERQLIACDSHRLMNHPDDIAVMFDKQRCHTIMSAARIPVPRKLNSVRSFEELKARMSEIRCRQVFVKLNHGSSASGIVAYRTNGTAHKAVSTTEMVRQNGELVLYNSRKIRVYENEREIAELVDRLCRHSVHVEEWFPKAKLTRKSLDLRVVVIAGQARHVIVRESNSPFTNLHLLNHRSAPERLRNKVGDVRWQQLMDCCETAMSLFPRSLYAGVDLMLGANFRSHAMAEINAFGDHIENSLWHGMDTYTAELAALGIDTYPLVLTAQIQAERSRT